MNKNKSIRDNLEYHISNSIKLFKGQFSLANVIQQELNGFDSIRWPTSTEFDIEAIKEERKNELNELLNDKHLHSKIESLLSELVDINGKTIQEDIEHQLIENLSNISQNIAKENQDFKLNLLFLEHDYEPEACFCGFDDPNYEHKLLSGQEYLSFDHKNELFNGAGRFDYTSILSPYLKFKEELGEERVEMINGAFSGGVYLEEIKNFFLLNGFLGIHLCLDRVKDKVREINIPMRNEVFIFGNEHDSEQLNIYVL